MEFWGVDLNGVDFVAIWGAFLSTILAAVKIFECFKGRFKVELGYVSRSSVEMGHDITVKNLSSEPIFLEYMELYSKRRWVPFSKKHYIWSPEDELLNCRIQPISVKEFNFSNQDYFSSSGRYVYARLYFIGRKPKAYPVGRL